MKNRIKVSIVGTNGIPARYGGYETLTEYLTKNLSSEFDFIVYCSKTQPKLLSIHNGAKLLYLPLKANGWQSILYDTCTLIHAAFNSKIILYLGPGAGFIVPFLKIFNKKIIVNHGGLNEWNREKYSPFQRFIARMGHKFGSVYSDINITDNNLLKESVKTEFGVDSIVIRYGGDHAIKTEANQALYEKYPFLHEDYFVNVSRAQIDNNLHIVLKAFEQCPQKKLVMVSNWTISKYGRYLKEEYQSKCSNIILLESVYEIDEINAIRCNAKAYIHSHSYCGTSPSLVEAMSLGLPIISFDVPTNRETTMEKALFYSNSNELIEILETLTEEELITNGRDMNQIAEKNYTWKVISTQYADLFKGFYN